MSHCFPKEIFGLKFYSIEDKNFFGLPKPSNHFDQFDQIKTVTKELLHLRKNEYEYLDLFDDFNFSKSDFEIILNKQLEKCNLPDIMNKFCNLYFITEFTKACSFSNKHQYKLFYFNFFKELNSRFMFYYHLINQKLRFKKNNIKIILLNKHHHCVNYILKHFDKKEILPTIVSLDSHPDMNAEPFPLTEEFDEEKYDPGMVLVPILSRYTKNQGFVWVRPREHSLLHNANLNCKMKLDIVKNNNKIEFILNTENNKKPAPIINTIPIKYIETSDLFWFNDNCIEDISPNYILNIDLDYFVTNGDSYNLKTNFCGGDLATISRTDPKNLIDKEEIRHIIRKLEMFFNTITKLKNSGKIPCYIVLCDSTDPDLSLYDVPYRNVEEGFESGFNTYTPPEACLWLKNTILQNLSSLLEDEICFD
jgi:hypothetical protein|tara:strand:+ start:5789 stop:7051 length:1263 start_codon:yes stop_codon:yes gene_type:complete